MSLVPGQRNQISGCVRPSVTSRIKYFQGYLSRVEMYSINDGDPLCP